MSMEALGALAILFGFVLVLAAIALWVWALVDALRRPERQWTAAGQSKVLWVVVIVGSVLLGGFGWLGAVLYLVVARPRLARAARDERQPGYGPDGYGPPGYGSPGHGPWGPGPEQR